MSMNFVPRRGTSGRRWNQCPSIDRAPGLHRWLSPADPDALDEIVKHIATIDSNVGHVRDALALAGTLVDSIKATHH